MRGSSFHRPLTLTLVYGLPPQGKRLVDSGGVTALGFVFSALRSARTMNTRSCRRSFNNARRPLGSALQRSTSLRLDALFPGRQRRTAAARAPRHRAAHLYRETRRRTGAIKRALTDNTFVAGIGNIFANESLFRAGIHANRAANRISMARYAKLVHEVKNVLTSV